MTLEEMLRIEREEGIEKGKAEEEKNRTAELLKRLIDKGNTFEDACEILSLSEEEIAYCKDLSGM